MVSSVVENNADHTIALDNDLAHTGIDFDLDAMRARRSGHRLSDRAHAADRVAPDALLAVHFSESMVQHHISRARRVGAGIVADDGVEAKQSLDQIVFEAVVEHVSGRSRKQIEQAALLLKRKAAQDARRADRVDDLVRGIEAKPFDQIRRRAQHELPDHVGDLFQSAHEAADRAGIPFAQAGDRRCCAAFAGEEVAAIWCGQKVLGAAFDDPQAVVVQPQVRDDLRIEQTDGVGRDRIAESGMEFLGHRRAAYHLAPLDDLDPQSGHREIGRAGEAVMACADDDDVGL